MQFLEIAVQSENFKGVPNGWKTILPVNFVVGENSAGKTSFLDLLSILDSADFTLTNQILGSVPGLNEPDDVITRYGDNKRITIGYIGHASTEEGHAHFSGKLASYTKVKDSLILDSVTTVERRSAYKTQLKGRTFFAKRFDLDRELNSLSDACKLADVAHNDIGTGFTQILASESGKSIGYQDWFQATLFSRLQLNRAYQGQRRLRTYSPIENPPLSILRYGPIRGETERLFFGPSDRDFDPSGSHYPFRLKKLSDEGGTALDAIREFGRASGLFDDLRVQNLRGSNRGAAFSILYQKYGKEFFSNELGYGLGQIVPIVTDVIATSGDKTFLIQQPEVHLHPKAQAAFGTLLPRIVKSGVTFVIETHSDFIIDRYRMELSSSPIESDSQIIFFYKPEDAERPACVPILIGGGGQIASMPSEYRDFFVNEALDKFEKL